LLHRGEYSGARRNVTDPGAINGSGETRRLLAASHDPDWIARVAKATRARLVGRSCQPRYEAPLSGYKSTMTGTRLPRLTAGLVSPSPRAAATQATLRRRRASW
jgi:hypothetical protein